MGKYFKASDCIHLHACRKVTAIANKVLYGAKGTQKMARGCNQQCTCYQSRKDLIDCLDRLSSEICSVDCTDQDEYCNLYDVNRAIQNSLYSIEDELRHLIEEGGEQKPADKE